ncbi:GMC oxidoreductase [Cristinia sonorae]|uniref:GMC oxidoreductase n=1 Tax=Cristinia sonorae TaxID=1940300 RepID=A0A8K0UN90_9AGAR|nr:GMC oxidoreductase [Cristinia sonorae]
MVAELEDIAGITFDYIVIGAGTAGLTVAARLAEDPSVSVVVLEAGAANLNDPKILLGGSFGATWSDPQYDWNFSTVSQKHSNNRPWPWNRGKGLGGSSAMNFYAWLKPPAADVNAFEELGNPGWTWDDYSKYTTRTEKFTKPADEQLSELPHGCDTYTLGGQGPLPVAIPRTSHVLDKLFFSALEQKGINMLDDPYGGNNNGSFVASATIDRAQRWTRSDSTTAFYLPNKDKPNFKVLIDANVSQIIFNEVKEGGDLVASGVQFIHGGQTYIVNATKDVVVSAGTINSPKILELSGIGRPEILQKIGVHVKVDLPGVGENVQDHIFVGVSMQLDPSVAHETFDSFRDPEFAKLQLRLHELGQKNRHQFGISSFAYFPFTTADPEAAKSFHQRVEDFIVEAKQSGTLPPGLAEQYDIQLRILKDDSVPDMEIVGFPGFLSFLSTPQPEANHLTVGSVLQHPFSRGTIHARSKDPLEQPDIDPHYFESPFDLELLVEHIKFIRKLAQTEPLKSGLVCEIDPGPNATSDEDIGNYIKDTCITCFHAVGSLSMLPRDKNGVVDPQLKVYGTKNVRVADLSIVPLHVAAHTVATAYAIGEKMADILKGV